MHGQRGRDGDAAAERAEGQGDEADGHSPGSPELCPPAGPAAGGHEQDAGEQQPPQILQPVLMWPALANHPHSKDLKSLSAYERLCLALCRC